jgi:hypothetical protein
VSCLAEQAKILFAEGEENNLDVKVMNERFARWHECGLCEQRYHGVVYCALGWACWKTYVGRPEADWARRLAMGVLGSGLQDVSRYKDALSVREAELSMMRRVGDSERNILAAQGNIANTYRTLDRDEEALRTMRDVYFGYAKLEGEDCVRTLQAANNYALSLLDLDRFQEAKALLLKLTPVARRALGESDVITFKIRGCYAEALYRDEGATLDELREAVTTLEDTERTARRVMGGAHPLVVQIGPCLREARDALAAREGDAVSSICEGVGAMTPT